MKAPNIERWIGLMLEAGVWERKGNRHGGVYFKMDELLHRHGEVFEWRPGGLPDGIPAGSPGRCFADAGEVASTRGDVTYCEGYAVSEAGLIVVHHAWLLGADGRVIDPTWDGFEDGRREYLGVRVPTRVLCEVTYTTEMWGVLDKPMVYERDWAETVAQAAAA